MDSQQPGREQQFRDLLRERSGPALFILDEDNRVVLTWPLQRELPEEVDRAVRASRADIDNPVERVFLLESGIVARVFPIEGVLGRYTAVLAEQFRARNHLAAGTRRYHLTHREHDVLHGILAGESTTEIATELGIAPSTVTLHVKSLLSKTASRSRAEMLAHVLAHSVELQSPR